jgi:carbonic anhydrase
VIRFQLGVRRLCRSTVVQQAWVRGQRLVVHAWVYRLTDGLLRDLGFGATSLAAAEQQYTRAVGSSDRYGRARASC